jgi:hypothetical protein
LADPDSPTVDPVEIISTKGERLKNLEHLSLAPNNVLAQWNDQLQLSTLKQKPA